MMWGVGGFPSMGLVGGVGKSRIYLVYNFVVGEDALVGN